MPNSPQSMVVCINNFRIIDYKLSRIVCIKGVLEWYRNGIDEY